MSKFCRAWTWTAYTSGSTWTSPGTASTIRNWSPSSTGIPTPQQPRPVRLDHHLAVCGKGLMFEGAAGRKMSDIVEPEYTIMLVEANNDRAVPGANRTIGDATLPTRWPDWATPAPAASVWPLPTVGALAVQVRRSESVLHAVDRCRPRALVPSHPSRGRAVVPPERKLKPGRRDSYLVPPYSRKERQSWYDMSTAEDAEVRRRRTRGRGSTRTLCDPPRPLR